MIEFGFNFCEVACYKVKDDIGESDLHAGLRGLDLIVLLLYLYDESVNLVSNLSFVVRLTI